MSGTEAVCAGRDCDRRAVCRGLCRRCYNRASRADALPAPVDELSDLANVIEGEEWRPVPDYEGIYEISDHGRIASLKYGKCHLLRPTPDDWGYLKIRLYREKTGRVVKVHKLVALAFHGARPEGLQIRHLDGDQLNNRASNLRYGTAAENAQDVARHGRGPSSRTHCPQGHPYDDTNTYRSPDGKRACRACQRAHHRRYDQQRKEAQ